MQTPPTIAPHGTWESPLAAADIAAKNLVLGQPQYDGDVLYWTEMRPFEDGRTAIVRRNLDGSIEDVIPPGFSCHTRVHEYGGSDYVVHRGVVVFANQKDQRLYKVEAGCAPVPITPESDARMRFADMTIDARRNRIICVCEEHDKENPPKVFNFIAAVPLAGGLHEVSALDGFDDFYASPRLSPCGNYLVWVSWAHPSMPWDSTQLWLVELDEAGDTCDFELIAGAENESVIHPQWSADGTLFFVSDRSGFWNLYSISRERLQADWLSATFPPKVDDYPGTAVLSMEAEFARPPWWLGEVSYALVGDEVVAAFNENGLWQLSVLRKKGSGYSVPGPRALWSMTRVESNCADFAWLTAGTGKAAMVACPSDAPHAIAELDLGRSSDSTGEPGVLSTVRLSGPAQLAEADISRPVPIECRTGNDASETTHAFLYLPKNSKFQAREDELPPLLVITHGGPTAAAGTAFKPAVQYWTTRGFAVVDVNYRGSTGFGRPYRERLKGNWGIVDVEDVVSVARHLADSGTVDGKRMAIRGGSAGGYTTLAALAASDTFAAGASHYGVSDVKALAEGTHKFESRYLDGLIGPYPAARAVYAERSPINHLDTFASPVIFFQGSDDKVVPPPQAQVMVQALKDRGVPVAYIEFEGEAHGFRKGPNIVRALEAELLFYGRIFGFAPHDAIDPVEIANLPDASV